MLVLLHVSENKLHDPLDRFELPTFLETNNSDDVNSVKIRKKAKKTRSGPNDYTQKGDLHNYTPTPPTNTNGNKNLFASLSGFMANSDGFFNNLAESINKILNMLDTIIFVLG